MDGLVTFQPPTGQLLILSMASHGEVLGGATVTHLRFNMGVSINGGTPIAGWFMRENPKKKNE